MATEMNMKDVTTSEFLNLIETLISIDELKPIIGLGPCGIGKTEGVCNLAKKLGIGYREMRLVNMTETDIRGIPFTANASSSSVEKNAEELITKWATNGELPYADRDGERGIFVLDEITSCTATVRAASYQLLDGQRSIGDYKLPDKWMVIALGNGVNDGGVFVGIESALLSRGSAYRVVPDLRSWKKWAIDSGVHPTVVAFLSSMPDYLHRIDPDEIASAIPCPRSWAGLSNILNKLEAKNNGKNLSTNEVDIFAAGKVGVEVSSMFSAFYEYNKHTISTEAIFNGTASTDIGTCDTQVVYIIVQNLIRELSSRLKLGRIGNHYSNEAVNSAATACKWIIKVGSRSRLDLAIMALTDISQNVEDFSNLILSANEEEFDRLCPEFTEFATKNSIVFG